MQFAMLQVDALGLTHHGNLKEYFLRVSAIDRDKICLVDDVMFMYEKKELRRVFHETISVTFFWFLFYLRA